MNYLAHAYLSFQQPPIVVGNMISDFIKGKKQYDYPLAIQKGIKLHRAIDNFTDTHAITKKAKQFFRPAVGPYCGAFLDIAYDHFLATDTNEFATPAKLAVFADFTYQVLEDNENILPERFTKMLPHMKQNNWLNNYQHNWGIQKSFANIAYKATYLTSGDECFSLFEQHYENLKQSYKLFFPELKLYSAQYLETLHRL
ncbi:ACP phosphodiesterase [Parasediminibacterium sp. JCM 36343]|uniref:acyl carrier protein phosphodiesterase n=1 Tax=Parasediminibacterium sp. JCM 36343 TaxID=3374279 RepID=UPI00397E6943